MLGRSREATRWVGRRVPGVLARAQTFATAQARANVTPKSINLTPYVSPLLFRLHPDTLQRHSADLAQENEQAMKQLNQFLELATCGCNNDAFQARKAILALSETRDDPAAPINFPMRYHLLNEQSSDGDGDAVDKPEFAVVNYIIQVPGMLVRRTLASASRAASAERKFETANAVDAPFAREWQRATKRILKDLFILSKLPVEIPSDAQTPPNQLAAWLAEEDRPDEKHRVAVATHNAAAKNQHDAFDKEFHRLLMREKNIVHEFTTGMEDGDASQHAVLASLLSQRVFFERVESAEQRQNVFSWLANVLLVHFMELRLHSLVWNKMMIMVTMDTTATPEVLWDDEQPEDGMAFLIPIEMEPAELVDFLYEHVEELEFALEEKTKRQLQEQQQKRHRQQTRQQHQRTRPARSTTRPPKQRSARPRRLSFYEEELLRSQR
ncbi:TPA: hypothetical protein N0F65_011521 [Lagenidium giganteum]|uniref:DUF4460 domain-containing protein n=1 Tax=Lagenidium giganteum TaxID=4803 RepID=A0AAV2ZAA7_9STRA|nr:TPA: hypothetical protein N0F65_011521 [Lagenidium giganteum]